MCCAGQFKQLNDEISKLKFVLTAKDQQIEDLKQRAGEAEQEAAALRGAAASELGEVESRAAAALEAANGETRGIREQCTKLQGIAREEKAKAEESKEQLLLVEIELEKLRAAHQRLLSASTEDTTPVPPEAAAPPEAASAVMVSGGHLESRVGGRCSLVEQHSLRD